MIYDSLMEKSDYQARRKSINEFNKKHPYQKRGMAITPVKFGISFTTSFLNQAGALVHIYKDGTMLVNHGGTEMGQGLHTKIQQIAALEMGVSLDRVRVNATDTAKVPNTSATAASAGTDLNGMAVKNAIQKLQTRIAGTIATHFTSNFKGPATQPEDIYFENNQIIDRKSPDRIISLDEAVMKCYLDRVSLSATGFYKTPKVHFDLEKGAGKPYHYFAFGMAVTEIQLDTLTGFYQNLRVDILHDVGDSVNPRIDIGQIEGGLYPGGRLVYYRRM